MQSDHYRAKAEQCRKWAERALTPREKDDWIELAAKWEVLAPENDLSGHLPWKVISS